MFLVVIWSFPVVVTFELVFVGLALDSNNKSGLSMLWRKLHHLLFSWFILCVYVVYLYKLYFRRKFFCIQPLFFSNFWSQTLVCRCVLKKMLKPVGMFCWKKSLELVSLNAWTVLLYVLDALITACGNCLLHHCLLLPLLLHR